jgi:hypothetical protein
VSLLVGNKWHQEVRELTVDVTMQK